MEDIVRMVRVLEYEGPREWVEVSLSQRGVKGEYKVGPHRIIREAILGEFPTILKEKC